MPTLAAWLHDLDPFALHIRGDFGLRWYGLSYIAGFLCAWLVLRWAAKRRLTPLTRIQAGDFVLIAILGVLIGGRLGYVLVYDRSLLTDFSSAAPWWGVLAINRGGMASHGGIVGVILASTLYARRLKLPALHIIDLTALVAPVGLFFGRLANFVNGELLGRIVAQPGAPAPAWAVKYPQELLERADEIEWTDAQRSELLALLEPRRLPGEDDLRPAIERLIREVQDGDASLANQLAPLLTARHPSQLYQALAEGLILFAALWLIWRAPRKPGVIGCWFLMVYGAGRIATEFWRLPDVGLSTPAGLSYGQWLSAAMVAAGATALPIVSRRDAQRFGGWAQKKTPPTSAASS